MQYLIATKTPYVTSPYFNHILIVNRSAQATDKKCFYLQQYFKSSTVLWENCRPGNPDRGTNDDLDSRMNRFRVIITSENMWLTVTQEFKH